MFHKGGQLAVCFSMLPFLCNSNVMNDSMPQRCVLPISSFVTISGNPWSLWPRNIGQSQLQSCLSGRVNESVIDAMDKDADAGSCPSQKRWLESVGPVWLQTFSASRDRCRGCVYHTRHHPHIPVPALPLMVSLSTSRRRMQ